MPRPMSFTQRSHAVDLVFTLALLCVFAVSCVCAVLVGANVYRQTVQNMEENFSTHTTLIYLWEKVKQSDVRGQVKLGEVAGATSLVLEQPVGESLYQTWIYPYDGTLRELMIPAGREFSPEDGTVILEVEGIAVEDCGDGLLRFTVPDQDGYPVELLVHLHS